MTKYITYVGMTLFVSFFVYSHIFAAETESPVHITELMALNNGSVLNDLGETSDWFELYNPTDTLIDLSGLYLTDKPDNLTKFQIKPNTYINPNSYLVFWADEKSSQGTTHVNFKLSTDGEYLALVDSDAETVIDHIAFGPQYSDISYGKIGDTWDYLEESTPGKENANIVYVPEGGEEPNGYEELDLYINEIMAKNEYWLLHILFGEGDEYSWEEKQVDWFELHNAEDFDIDLSGMYLTDDKGWHTQYEIPEGLIIPANSYMVFAANSEPDIGPKHVNFSLNVDGEYIGLYAPDGKTIIDEVEFGPQKPAISYGKLSDGNVWAFFETPTIEKSNPEAGISLIPSIIGEVDKDSHIQSSPFFVGLAAKSVITENPVTIYYTLDGSEPTEESYVYNTILPINITTTTVVRAIAKEDDGFATSNIVTKTYFIGFDSTIPVVSMVTPANALTSFKYDEPEKLMHLEYFSPDGEELFSLQGDAKAHGGHGSFGPQRSLRFYAKQKYGTGIINHTIFEDKDIDEFKRILFRSSNHDNFGPPNFGSHLHDVMLSELAKDTNTGRQAWQPVNVFFNGEYVGVYNLRERLDEYYAASNYGADKDSVAIGGYAEVGDGNPENVYLTHGSPLMKDFLVGFYALESDSPALVDYFESTFDVDNFIDYSIIELFAQNNDWPHNNIFAWREASEGGKWRYQLKDGDLAFYWQHTGPTDENGNTPIQVGNHEFVRSINKIGEDPQEYMDAYPGGGNYKNYTTWGMTIGKMLDNEELRQKFVNRFADLLNTTLDYKTSSKTLANVKARIAPEIPKQIERWVFSEWKGVSHEEWFSYWEDKVSLIDEYLEVRQQNVRDEIVTYFDDVYAHHTLTLNQTCGGSIQVNKLEESTMTPTWTGTYFQGVPITIQATPKPGYTFAGWSGAELPNELEVELNLAKDTKITPIFKRPEGFFVNSGFNQYKEGWETEGSVTPSKSGDDQTIRLAPGKISQTSTFDCETGFVDGNFYSANLSVDVLKPLFSEDTTVEVTLTYLDEYDVVLEKHNLTMLSNSKEWKTGYMFVNEVGERVSKKISAGTRGVRIEVEVKENGEKNVGALVDNVHLYLYNRLDRTTQPTKDETKRFSYDRSRYDAFLKKQQELTSPTRRYRLP